MSQRLIRLQSNPVNNKSTRQPQRSRGRRILLLGVLFALGLPLGAIARNAIWNQEQGKPSQPLTSQILGTQPELPKEVRALLQDRKYEEAQAALDAAMSADKEHADRFQYLKGRAFALAEKYDEAIAAFNELETQHPDSSWLRQARFAAAIAYMRKGNYRSAEQIYRAEAEYLLGAERKQEIAAIYLEFADLYFHPEKESTDPNYAKAFEFYQQAMEVGPAAERKEQVELRIARCLQLLGNPQEAINRLERFIKTHPEHGLNAVARYRLGECYMAQGSPRPARRAWQDLLAKVTDGSISAPAEPDEDAKIDDPASPQLDLQGVRMNALRYRIAHTFGLPQPQTDEALNLGVAELRTFLAEHPDDELAPNAQLQIARSFFARGQWESGIEELQQFLANDAYAEDERTPEARVLLGQAYQAQKKFKEALAAWTDYLAKHPAHGQWTSVQRMIIDTEYLQGQEALAEEDYQAARSLWDEFLRKHPLEDRCRLILFDFGRMEFLQDEFEKAIEAWRTVVSKYPGSNEASRAQFMIAMTLETKLGRLEDALKEYALVKYGEYAPHAAVRHAALTQTEMTIATTRVYRTDEDPAVDLISRNVESVDVSAYRIDLETYFRKMHLARGVENLDVALIDPDSRFSFPVSDYQKYQQFQSSVAIRKDGEGDVERQPQVMAVTVSEGKLEATTLVIQSDLDVIVKSSRDEVFVFAQNMRTGEAWPDVRLLISDGSTVFAEVETGEDGVYQGTYDELQGANDVRVFAVSDGHVASNIISLDGIGVAQGLTEKGYIYTDRPIYRPGEFVHIRGVVRDVEDDRYAINADQEFSLEVFDARGRSLSEEAVQLDEFGAFHTQVTLPPEAAQGAYRLALVESNPALGQSPQQYAGVFTVAEFKLEPVQLTIETDRAVYYRGEVIEGEILAQYYYGAPVASKQITYTDLDGRSQTATTDAQGRVPFRLETRELDESQIVAFTAQLNELGIAVQRNFIIATQGFSLDVATSRASATYLAGESFEATVTARDAEGKPLAENITLSVLKRTRSPGSNRVGETTVNTHELTTDAETGKATITLNLDDGAQYMLRASGIDRFEKSITGSSLVNVSDDTDGVRLRILAEKHSYKVGDDAKVNLHWREEPTLALITYQGARVLKYQIVRLATGDNELTMPMSAELAPNFQLSVAVMQDIREAKSTTTEAEAELAIETLVPPQRFHTAESPFVVARDLRVTMETKRAAGEGDLRPGDDVEVTITTTNNQGKPVSAKLSLGMVEQALAERFDRQEGEIDSFFRGQPREAAVRTTSSITFNYRPATEAINPDLLSEADRIALAHAERSRLEAMTFNSPNPNREALARTATPVPPDANASAEMDRDRSSGTWPFNDAQQALESALQPQAEVAINGQFKENARGTTGFGINSQDMPFQVFGRPSSGGFGGGGLGGGGGRFDRRQADGADFLADAESRRYLSGDAVLNRERANYYFELSGKQLQDLPLLITEGKSSKATIVDYFHKAAVNQWGDRDATVLFADGRQTNVNLGTMWARGPDSTRRLAEKLAEDGAVVVQPGSIQETGYWSPAIVTDEDGKATITVSLPSRSTAWQLQAKGITADTLAGETTTELTASKELFGELKLPAAFTSGDEARIAVSVHNQMVAADANTQVELELKTTIGGKSTSEKRTIEAAAGVSQFDFPLTVKLPEGATVDSTIDFELIVRSGDLTDTVQRSIPLTPFGEVVFVTASGAAESDTIAWVEQDKQMPLSDRKMEIVVGPSVEQNLMEIILGPATPVQQFCLNYASAHDVTTSELMAALSLRNLAGGPDSPTAVEAQTLDGRIRSSISALVASQQDDGSWSWSGRGGRGSAYATAQAVWALAEAKSGGYRVPDENHDRALTYLANHVVSVSENDYETKAVLLHAMAAAGRGDFALANRLHRNRPSLSSAALAHLALALIEMNRGQMASELLDLLAERNLDTPTTRRKVAGGSLPWSHSAVELHALYALALQAYAPGSPQAKEQVEWLMTHRRGTRWTPEKATGPATAAVAGWYARNQFEHERYTLKLFVNNALVEEIEVDKDSLTQRVQVPTELLQDGKQQINFEMTGRGRFAYQCVLSGFVPAEKLTSTSQEWRVTRQYEPAPREFDGRQVPRGFDVAERYRFFRNNLTQLPQGNRGIVHLNVNRYNLSSNVPDSQLEYLVITEPLPAGVQVIEDSISGTFERFEISSDSITFFVGNRRSIGTISFQVHGYLPGVYQAGPTIVRDAYRPESLAVSKIKTLTVLAEGKASADEYRMSPRELFEFGKRNFAKKNYAEAGRYLDDLFANWTLRADAYRETALMLLEVNLQTNRPAEIVRLFEIVKERYPDEEIPFEKIVRVAQAYEEVGEYERAYLVYRATVEGSFARESRVAGFLEAQQEFVRSVKVMDRLLMEYPPEPYVAAATYYLSQRIYAKAPTAEADAELREENILGVDLVRDALTRLESFLTHYPDDPAAAQAAFSAANALLELEAFRPAIAACNRYAERYDDSEYLDSFWYVIGYCHFALGEHEDALAMCEKVAEATRMDANSGRETESPNKWQAVYIMGQVYHSLGKAKEAIDEYERVKEQFADAAQAIAYFTHEEAELPEVSFFEPGKDAKVNLTYRNVASLDTKVYRIDLTKFGLLRRDLDDVTKINLAGIKPLHESTSTLGDGKDYADKEHELDLPLDEEGAYLVVCRADDLHATGLVLVTPLTLEVQEEQLSGRVRATVKDNDSGRYLKDVHVKVIGSRTPEIVSGETDLRGVFVADNLAGQATVIAQADSGRYAFFRGETELGPPMVQTGGQVLQQQGQASEEADVKLLEQLKGGNGIIIEQQRQNLENLYNNTDKGVKAKSAY
ncbi:MAG: tetratricopeptide repeat protein [Pirellulales bacterium]|nr:tetratricopeptide repeat protein [Pirellulales bacterium]